MAERNAFLEIVRKAREAENAVDGSLDSPVVPSPALPSVDLVEHFVQQLRAVDGVAHRATADEVPTLVGELLASHDARSVMTWDESELPVDGIGELLDALGVELVDGDTPRHDHAGHNPALAEIVAGITGADAGLAESGSVVVSSGSGRPRMASLVPLVHIALLPASRIHRSLTDFMLAEPEWVSRGANLVAVTGPSRTGDIEQELNLGVHGPKYLHVIVIESS